MESIRVKSGSEYVIEVNDKGDTISFDPSDITMTSKLLRTYEHIDALMNEYKEKAKQLDEKPVEAIYEGEYEGKEIKITKKDIESEKLTNELFDKTREIMDEFLGDGACQKIFGDKNWFTMFDDLAEQLEPHFKQIGINAQKIRTGAAKKYAPNREIRRVMK